MVFCNQTLATRIRFPFRQTKSLLNSITISSKCLWPDTCKSFTRLCSVALLRRLPAQPGNIPGRCEHALWWFGLSRMRLTSRGTKSKNYGLPSCPSPFLAIGTCDVSQLPPQQIHQLALLNHASPLRVIKNYLVCYFSFSLLSVLG